MKKSPGSKRIALALAALVLLGIGGAGIYFRRTIGLRKALSLDYWTTRAGGHEFYNPDSRAFKRGSRDYKDVLLTIDDSPHPKSLPSILQTLKEEHVPALFFVIGKNVKKAPELTKEILDEGHEIGNHTQDHLRLNTLTAKQIQNEITECEVNVLRATGRKMTFLRPPGMQLNATVSRIVKDKGYILVGWSLGAKDFIPTTKDGDYKALLARSEEVTPQTITADVLKQVQNGSIILLHDSPLTAEALKPIIDQLKADGYTFISATEMLSKLPNPISVVANPPGKI